MATAKQIAARKLFAQRAKAGAFKRKARKKNADAVHIDIASHNTGGRNVRAKNPHRTVGQEIRLLRAEGYPQKRAVAASLSMQRAGKLRKGNPAGVRVIYNKLLGGWFIVRGPHQTPLNGRFDSKAEAQAWLAAGARRTNPRKLAFAVYCKSTAGVSWRKIAHFFNRREGFAYARAYHRAFPSHFVKVDKA